MKFFFYIILFSVAALLVSCSSTRNAYTSGKRNNSPRFLNNVRVTPGEKVSSKYNSYVYTENNTAASSTKNYSSKNAGSLQVKYANMLGVAPAAIDNETLIETIDDWYGVPYHIGGISKSGIDCSGFAQMLLRTVYNKQLPRTSEEQYEQSKHIDKEDLREGDLVFFHTSGGTTVTHVGVYLQNNKFVHASTSSGVMISDLSDSYWQKTYKAAGRINDN